MSVESMAIVIHKASTGRFGDDILSVVRHTIHHHKETSVLGPGVVFSNEDRISLMEVLADQTRQPMELLDERVLMRGEETLVWYRPRQKTTVNTSGCEYSVPLPSLVFACHKGQLYVMAYQGERRPKADTNLFWPGLPNIQSNAGQWCSGGNTVPSTPSQRQIERIEDVFFMSPFTHWSAGIPQQADSDFVQWFAALSKQRRFPMKNLQDARANLNDWLKTITRG